MNEAKSVEYDRLAAEISSLRKENGQLVDSLGNDKQQALNTMKEEMLEAMTRK
jgi:hypothetical protein